MCEFGSQGVARLFTRDVDEAGVTAAVSPILKRLLLRDMLVQKFCHALLKVAVRANYELEVSAILGRARSFVISVQIAVKNGMMKNAVRWQS